MKHARGKASDGRGKRAIRLTLALGALCLMASASVTCAQDACGTPQGGPFFTPVCGAEARAVSLAVPVEAAAAGGPDMTAALPEPRLECVTQLDATRFDALLGYDLVAGSVVTIPAGPDNGFSPGLEARGQPEFFRPGSHPGAFAIRFDGSELVWSLAGQTVTVSAASPRCAASCPSPCPEGAACEDGACVPVCGDGVCARDESCANCPGDCQCDSGLECLRIPAQTIRQLETERVVELPPGAACCTPIQCGVGWECGSGDSCGAPLDCGQCDPGSVCMDHVCVRDELALLSAPPDSPAPSSDCFGRCLTAFSECSFQARLRPLEILQPEDPPRPDPDEQCFEILRECRRSCPSAEEPPSIVEPPSISEPRISRVTGLDAATRMRDESEAVIDISRDTASDSEVLNVAYNDLSLAPEITFPVDPADPSGMRRTRRVCPGASLMGWSHAVATPLVNDAVPLAWTHRKLPAPFDMGVSILFGDPSIASAPTGTPVLLIANLAVPTEKLPPATMENPDRCFLGSFRPGGACIALSTDGGRNATIVQCLRDTEIVAAGHFYDGSSLAIGPDGAAYAAFSDTERLEAAIWKSADIHNFDANPFEIDRASPGRFDFVAGHLRARVAPDNALWLMTHRGNMKSPCSPDPSNLASCGGLAVNIFGRAKMYQTVAQDVAPWDGSFTLANGRRIRLGVEYAFDFGLNEAGEREMRFIYTYRDRDGYYHVRGGRCPNLELSPHCQPEVAWDSLRAGGMDSHQFRPNIRFSPRTGVWWVTYQSTQGGNGSQVAMWAGRFAADPFVPERVTALQEPCPYPSGYWGDYDEMAPDLLTDTFWRTYSDSSQGVCTMGPSTANPLDVSAVRFSAQPPGAPPPDPISECLSRCLTAFGRCSFEAQRQARLRPLEILQPEDPPRPDPDEQCFEILRECRRSCAP